MGKANNASEFYHSARRMGSALPAITAVGLGLVGSTASAAPEEIQVYMDDMTKPDHWVIKFVIGVNF
jgi:hypothetical protein